MKALHDAGVDSPRRDCMVLLEDLLDKDRSWLTAHAEFELTKEQVSQLDSWISRRIKREPLAYIRGKAWFYGRFFEVNPNVMIPRPESESFIDILKDLQLGDKFTVVDVGTGSGCLAITTKLEFPYCKTFAIDQCVLAIETAKINATKYKVSIDFLHGDLLIPIKDSSFDLEKTVVIIANLPYVPLGLITSPEITTEPSEALFSGKDGLDHYQRFWHEIDSLKKSPDYILCESLTTQHEAIKKLAKDCGYSLARTDTLVQLFKKN